MKKYVLGVILASIFTFIIYNIVFGYMQKHDVEENGKETVGKYVSQKLWAKGESNIFEFYIGRNKIRGNVGRVSEDFNQNIGKFYMVTYSEKYKGVVRADFDKEVTDTTQIFEAGFSKDDLHIKN